MIVKITSKRHLFSEDHYSEEELVFFKGEGAIKKKNEWSDLELCFIGPISNVPVCALNNKNSEIEYYNNNPSEYSEASSLLSLTETFSKKNFESMRNQGPSISIHIPSPELSFFNAVDWLEDACTQKLQDHLDDGWRIVAVIPRPGQRRPDYIIGKRK